MVAVGFHPTGKALDAWPRRVATLGTVLHGQAFNRRSATQSVLMSPPWTEVHGYPHRVAPRQNRTHSTENSEEPFVAIQSERFELKR